jgi:hypothetical protein
VPFCCFLLLSVFLARSGSFGGSGAKAFCLRASQGRAKL